MSNYFTNKSLVNYYNTSIPQTNTLLTTNFIDSDGIDIAKKITLYMFGKRNKCNYISNDIDIGNYFQYDNCNIVELVPNSIINNSYYIWNKKFAEITAPVSEYIWLYYTYYSNEVVYNANIYVKSLCYGTIYITNSLETKTILLKNNYLLNDTITILNGLNYIKVYAYNYKNKPAGLLISIYTGVYPNRRNIINTNSNWAWVYPPNYYKLTHAYEIRAYNQSPWDGWINNYKTDSDKLSNAFWISINPFQTDNTIQDTYTWFYHTFFYDGNGTANKDCTLYAICDARCIFYINTPYSEETTNYNSIIETNKIKKFTLPDKNSNNYINRGTITVSYGLNYIKAVTCNDTPITNIDPTGLILCIYDGSNRLTDTSTNSNWLCSYTHINFPDEINFESTAT